MTPDSPINQGFAIRITAAEKVQVRVLERNGFRNISFRGEYPIGFVQYEDPDCPVSVALEAFSPFIPLNAEDSALPVTVMRYTVKNLSSIRVHVQIAGWLENPVCLYTGKGSMGRRRNRILRRENLVLLDCTAEPEDPGPGNQARPDILFEDFEKETYEGWTATGSAFGAGPIERSQMPAYQGEVGNIGRRLVNTHNTRNGEDVVGGDAHIGTLTSRPFRIERNYIAFLIGGGAHKDKTCINLLLDGRVVDSACGENDNRMTCKAFDVRALQGRMAQLQIVDNERGSWGNVGVDHIVLTDTPPRPPVPLQERHDFGSMVLALLGHDSSDFGIAALPSGFSGNDIFAADKSPPQDETTGSLTARLAGAVGRGFHIAPAQQITVAFIIAWHFPNLQIPGLPSHDGRHYARQFSSARQVAEYVASRFDVLRQQTRLWHDTWYDSTLPWWFLTRTFLNSSILATSTCHWLGNGRFYSWEGVGCCPGTCAHVWHYAHALARLFPDLERRTREKVDLGVAMDQKTGAIRFRAEHNDSPAADGQAGVILRSYREHQMSPDDVFLRRNWPRIRKALEYLIDQDADDDGILQGRQHNTLDTDWYGPVPWLSSLYLAALRAGQEMAAEVADDAFARRCGEIFQRGQQRLVELCWNGEYFVHRPDPDHPEAIKVGNGCHIDQVFGQSWAWQLGLGRILPEANVRSALQAIWKYNFSPDVGIYRRQFRLGRWYAMPGEAGLLMCTWPGGDRENAQGKAPDWAFGYFNECMNGFEYQVAGHMIWEGMLTEGLAITRAVHERYHASKRNPWNEVECGDHYARSMASYGVFLAACGYEYHGPKGRLAFRPRCGSESFRAAFTAAEGWGSFWQSRRMDGQLSSIILRWGRLSLRQLGIDVGSKLVAGQLGATLNDGPVPILQAERSRDGRIEVVFPEPVVLQAGDQLTVRVAPVP